MPNESDTRPRVVVTCTTMGSLRIETMAALMNVQRDDRYRVSLEMTHDRPYASALNKAAERFCADSSLDWWLHTDNDQAWVGAPLDAIADGKDLVGFPAPIYRPADGGVISLMAWDIVDTNDPLRVKPSAPNGQLKRVDVINSGAFLIRLDALRGSGIPAPFSRAFTDRGVQVRGCDIEFCRKWREARLEIWADFRCLCRHYKTIDLLEVMSDMAAIAQRTANI